MLPLSHGSRAVEETRIRLLPEASISARRQVYAEVMHVAVHLASRCADQRLLSSRMDLRRARNGAARTWDRTAHVDMTEGQIASRQRFGLCLD